jgi:hypothetical protein
VIRFGNPTRSLVGNLAHGQNGRIDYDDDYEYDCDRNSLTMMCQSPENRQ